MQLANSLKSSLAGAVAAITISSLFISQSVFAAGSIISWGEFALDSGELDGNDFVAISAGYIHSLALKQDGSIVGGGRDGYCQAITQKTGSRLLSKILTPARYFARKAPIGKKDTVHSGPLA